MAEMENIFWLLHRSLRNNRSSSIKSSVTTSSRPRMPRHLSNPRNTADRKLQSIPSRYSRLWSTLLCSKECAIRAVNFSHGNTGGGWKYWSACHQTTKIIITLWIWEYCRWPNSRPSHFFLSIQQTTKTLPHWARSHIRKVEKVIQISQAMESAAHHSTKFRSHIHPTVIITIVSKNWHIGKRIDQLPLRQETTLSHPWNLSQFVVGVVPKATLVLNVDAQEAKHVLNVTSKVILLQRTEQMSQHVQ